jgi:arylsulfatase A-like enzyme
MKKSWHISLIVPFVLIGSCKQDSSPLSRNAVQKPNVLFIAVDDLNDWLGCYNGHPQAITPNIDQLAREGILFSNAHCPSPICQPCRSSMLTGKLPTTTGLQWFIPRTFKEDDSFQGFTTLPEYFSQNGYYTMGVGKISHKPIPEMYDEFGGHGNAGPSKEREEDRVYTLGHPLWDWGAYPEQDSMLPDYVTTQWALQQLKRDYDKPFFLAVGFHRPHVPLYVPQKWFDLYPLDSIELPTVYQADLTDISTYAQDLIYGSHAPRHQWMVENNEWKHAVQSYLASISFVDHYVGEILSALRSGKYASNTLIVLWSDHGFHLGEKLRWEKRSLWDESTKVPLIFAGPGIPENQTCIRTVGLIDLYPTLAELCGLPPETGQEGRSIAPLLKDPEMEWDHPVITSLGPDSHSVRTEKWRLIAYGDGSMELYNMITDPNEWHNLVDFPENQNIIGELKKHLPVSSAPLDEDYYDSGSLTLYN